MFHLQTESSENVGGGDRGNLSAVTLDRSQFVFSP